LHRSAQYSTIAGEIFEGGDAEVTTKGPKAELGLAHVPAVQTHGGVQVLGEIRQEAILDLSALRALAAPGDAEDTLKLRRYVLGLALVTFTAPMEPCLREGCELVPSPEKDAEWKLVQHDGKRKDLVVTHCQALAFPAIRRPVPPSGSRHRLFGAASPHVGPPGCMWGYASGACRLRYWFRIWPTCWARRRQRPWPPALWDVACIRRCRCRLSP